MISIIFTIVLMGVMVYVFVLDGNKGNVFIKKNMAKENKDNKTETNKSYSKNMYSTQDNINIKKIKSIGDGEDASLIIKDNNSYVGILEVYCVNYNL